MAEMLTTEEINGLLEAMSYMDISNFKKYYVYKYAYIKHLKKLYKLRNKKGEIRKNHILDLYDIINQGPYPYNVTYFGEFPFTNENLVSIFPYSGYCALVRFKSIISYNELIPTTTFDNYGLLNILEEQEEEYIKNDLSNLKINTELESTYPSEYVNALKNLLTVFKRNESKGSKILYSILEVAPDLLNKINISVSESDDIVIKAGDFQLTFPYKYMDYVANITIKINKEIIYTHDIKYFTEVLATFKFISGYSKVHFDKTSDLYKNLEICLKDEDSYDKLQKFFNNHSLNNEFCKNISTSLNKIDLPDKFYQNIYPVIKGYKDIRISDYIKTIIANVCLDILKKEIK